MIKLDGVFLRRLNAGLNAEIIFNGHYIEKKKKTNKTRTISQYHADWN